MPEDTGKQEQPPEPQLRIRVNGKDRAVPVGATVLDLLEALDLNPALVVVERNRSILDRNRYGEVLLNDEDSLELVHFVGGG